jgi:glycine cleavage system H protein
VAKYEIPEHLRYSEEDEWARLEGNRVTMGITDYAQQQLGDIVYVELPEVGRVLDAGEPFGVIESVKAVSDLYAPVAGEVVEVNEVLAEQPEAVNEDCYGDGWMIAIQVDDASALASLLDAAAYLKHVNDRSE